MEHTYIVVVASNYRQAEMVCRQLELPPPDSRHRDPIAEVVIYAGPPDAPRLMGLEPDRVIFATPILCNGVDRERLREVRALAETRAKRKNAPVDVVRT